MYGVYLIAVLVVTGGVIAFIGDRLGTKIGKKRLSIFGLRPRHTSIIITIFTGICITTLTFGVMAATSENVRTALFGMEQLHANMEATRKDLVDASRELSVAKAEQEKAKDDLYQSKLEIEKMKAEQEKLKQEQEALQQESERLKEGNRQLEEAKTELTARNDELARMNDELAANNEELAAEKEQLLAENAELEERTQHLREGLITIREGDITFRAGEVLASGVVQSEQSEASIAEDMASMAQLAMRNVSARLGENASDADLWIYQPELEAAIKTISESSQDMVVRVVAAGNLVRGEPVRAKLELYPNRTIYEDNEFITAQTYRIKDEKDAEQVVMAFLSEVNAAATAKGILPDPIRGSVGVMDGETFFEMVQSLQQMQGDVVISAYARGATDALGPLRLNIKLEGVENSGKAP